MPFTEAARALGAVGQAAADVYQVQLTQLQNTQRAQSTLALQRQMREMDQIYMRKLQEQMSLIANGDAITEDWLDEDFRQQRMREMFDERTQDIRSMVSTPEGRMEFETRAESMWQQYEFNWRDRSAAAMQAVNQAALPQNIQMAIDEANLLTAKATEALINEQLIAAVASGILPAERREEVFRAARENLYDTLLMGFIRNPTHKDGSEPSNFQEALMINLDKIDEHLLDKDITRAHAEDLRKEAKRVHDVMQQQHADRVLRDSNTFVHQTAYRLAFEEGPVRMHYRDLSQMLGWDEDYWLMNEKQRHDYEQQMKTRIDWLNDDLQGTRAQRINNMVAGFKVQVMEWERRNLPRAREAISSDDDSDLMQLVNSLLENGEEVAAENIMRWTEKRFANYNYWQAQWFSENSQSGRMFDEWMESIGETRNSEFGMLMAASIARVNDLVPGRENFITPEMVTDAKRIHWDNNFTELMKSSWFSRDAAQAVAQPGWQTQQASEIVRAFATAPVDQRLFGDLLNHFFSKLSEETFMSADGTVNLPGLQQSVDEIFGRNRDQMSPEVQKVADTLVTGTAGLIEFINIAGTLIAEQYTLENGFSLKNLEFDARSRMPLFTITGVTEAGREVSNRFMVDSTNPDDVIIRLYRDPTLTQMQGGADPRSPLQVHEWSLNNLKDISRKYPGMKPGGDPTPVHEQPENAELLRAWREFEQSEQYRNAAASAQAQRALREQFARQHDRTLAELDTIITSERVRTTGAR